MKTCVSMNCPFISFCKDYNFLVDRSEGCATQNKILTAAHRLEKKPSVKGKNNSKRLQYNYFRTQIW